MKEKILLKISKELNINITYIKNVMTMLEDGNTIPFIARYRKEATNNLNEEQLKIIEDAYNYGVNLEKRKETVKKQINEKGMLTPELELEIEKCEKLSEVEDIYLPFKERKKTKGTEAIKLGLLPLAEEIMTLPNKTEEELATPYLSDVVKTIDEAMTQAGYIIADVISNNAKYRKYIRDFFWARGIVTSKIKKNAEDKNKLYEIYYDFKQKVTEIKSYRVLAICRAENQNIISYNIEADENQILSYLSKQILGSTITPINSRIETYIKDAYKRLIEPSIEREIKKELFENSSKEAINEFKVNLENLLLTPPIKSSVVLGFDPAFRTGCKLAVVDASGEVLKIDVIYPHEPKNEKEASKKKLLELINTYKINVIAIGNGTASRESEKFVSEVINNEKLDVKYTIVSEAGASVYSASDIARKEFPDFSVEQRSAVSIARRLQDALSELVKIDPKSIGVGLYQHDLKQKELENELGFVTSMIVNNVGVNINTAGESILKYVSGLTKKTISSLLEYRKKKHKINNREELKKIKGIDSFTFEQCAGFLRIIDGSNQLDKTNIHPEDYELVSNILNDNQIDLNLIGTEQITGYLEKINFSKYNISEEKIDTIKQNLSIGIIDPRDEIKPILLRSDVLTIEDLKIGDLLQGTVRNVLPFGAFVDIGLHDDALVHISKISKDFIKHPSEVLKVGDIIEVYIDSIDKEKERVNLTLINEF